MRRRYKDTNKVFYKFIYLTIQEQIQKENYVDYNHYPLTRTQEYVRISTLICSNIHTVVHSNDSMLMPITTFEWDEIRRLLPYQSRDESLTALSIMDCISEYKNFCDFNVKTLASHLSDHLCQEDLDVLIYELQMSKLKNTLV